MIGSFGVGSGLAHESIEAGDRRDPAVERLRGGVSRFVKMVTPGLDVPHRRTQQLRRLFRPPDTQELDEPHHILAIRSLCVRTHSTLEPGFEHPVHRGAEAADLGEDRRRLMPEEDGRERGLVSRGECPLPSRMALPG